MRMEHDYEVIRSRSGKLDLNNRNGSPLCHAFGCRKHTKLQQVFGGMFCYKHKHAIEEIRKSRNCAKTTVDIIYWRLMEQTIRKRADYKHVYFIFYLIFLEFTIIMKN